MLYAILLFSILGAGLIAYAKANDAAEAYGVIIPFLGGCVSLFVAIVLSIIHWVF